MAPPLSGREGHATLVSSIANLCNTIVGAGILGLPFAFMSCGMSLGLTLIFGCAGACCLSLHLLSTSAKTAGVWPSSFYTVAIAAIPTWTFLIDLAVAVKCFGVATSYLIVSGDMMPNVMAFIGAPHAWQDRDLWVSISVAVAGPLACFAKLDALRHTSLLSILCVVYLAGLALAVAIAPDALACERDQPRDECRGPVEGGPSPETLRILSIFIFGFTCQQNIFAVVNELARPSARRVGLVIAASVGISLALYLVVAVGGFLVYGNRVHKDVLINFPEDSAAFTLARVGISLVVIFSYPLQAHPSRRCALTLLRATELLVMGRTPGALELHREMSGPILKSQGVVPDNAWEPHEAAPREIGPVRLPTDPQFVPAPAEEGELSLHEISISAAAPPLPTMRGDTSDAPAAAVEAVISGDHGGQGPTRAAAGAPAPAAVPAADLTGLRDALADYTPRYWIYTAGFVACSWAIALAVDDLGKVMAVVGATGSTAVSYILPGAIYCKLHPSPHLLRSAAMVMLGVGVVIVPLALYAIFFGG
mmetsp:Transcript_19567/g.61989  ORF Transcript_19567/g.61989 Transcript_19567/m.61989 type:complete len:536 (+) Transcript_19567:120-1727(+)